MYVIISICDHYYNHMVNICSSSYVPSWNQLPLLLTPLTASHPACLDLVMRVMWARPILIGHSSS